MTDALSDPEYRLPKGRFRPIEKPQASSFWVGKKPDGFTAACADHFEKLAPPVSGVTLGVAVRQGTL